MISLTDLVFEGHRSRPRSIQALTHIGKPTVHRFAPQPCCRIRLLECHPCSPPSTERLVWNYMPILSAAHSERSSVPTKKDSQAIAHESQYQQAAVQCTPTGRTSPVHPRSYTDNAFRMGSTGFEPARPCGHKALNLARLPIPPRAQTAAIRGITADMPVYAPHRRRQATPCSERRGSSN